MNTTTATDTDFAAATPKGTVLHIVRDGATHTVCGRHTGVNPRYAHAGSFWTRPVEEATCPKCKREEA